MVLGRRCCGCVLCVVCCVFVVGEEKEMKK